jgi:1-acyl-sn-glycerol-3-phosphate acyltransferase
VAAAPPADARAETAARAAEVERRVEAALDGLEERLQALAERTGLSGARRDLGAAVARLLPALRDRLAAFADAVRVLGPPEGLDPFGMDPRLVERAQPLLDFLLGTWWRAELRGAAHVPAVGPAVVVANHAGAVPWDTLVLRYALRRAPPSHRDLRPLLDDRECALPVFGGLAVRLGAVRATPEAAGRILADGSLLGVFPEGSRGAAKPWRDRYRIQRFGRGGFVKVALRARAPIVPCAIVGSEEAAPGVARAGWLAERLGLPALGTLTLLRVGPAALVPLPSKWTLRLGEPIPLHGLGPADADDPATVNALTEQVRSSIQAMLDEDVAARSSVFL